MKEIAKYLKRRKHILFMDFEATQFSHEMIAFGAVRVDLDNKYCIRKVHKGIKYYVQAKNPIGKYVTNLTGITEEKLAKEGIPYNVAIKKIKKYCGFYFEKDMTFAVFGTLDTKIIINSMELTPEVNEEDCKHICRNSIDLCAIISQYVKDEKNNPLSLVHYLEKFEIPLTGEPHDPLTDATHLMLLYKGVMTRSDILYSEYLKVLAKQKSLPLPVKDTISSLLNGEDVSSQDFKKKVKDFIG